MITAASPHESHARVDRIFEAQRAAVLARAKPSLQERRKRIKALLDAMFRYRQELRDAMFADFAKPAAEVDLSEIYAVVSEARHALRQLPRWLRAKRVSAPLALLGSRSRVEFEPKGVVLIISPWNFPVNLTFGPLVSALAAGNRAIIKPSELTPATSAVMARIVSDVFAEDEVAVIEGGADVAQRLLQKPFDHIFFTGSPAVGRIVMRAASEHLTSVTLELGGKSPVVVDETADVREAARKIAWGKSLNAGQVCVAPDYVLVHENVRDEFAAAFVRELESPFGADHAESPHYTRIVNERHYDRIHGLLAEAVEGGAKVEHRAQPERDSRFMAPTLVHDAPRKARIWSEEIFGPLMPVQTYRSVDEAIARIREGEKPLVLYVFSRDRKRVRRILDGTSSGAAVMNETLLHFFQHNLPFGGVGYSGMGKSHGRHGFESFSNARGVFSQPTRFSTMQLLYPPYTKWKQKLIDLMLKWL